MYSFSFFSVSRILVLLRFLLGVLCMGIELTDGPVVAVLGLVALSTEMWLVLLLKVLENIVWTSCNEGGRKCDDNGIYLLITLP